MDQDQGMLFDFGQGASTDTGFWMPDMKFNLDFIWIKNNKVIGITSNVPAPASPTTPLLSLPVYYPPSPIDRQVEVNAGWAKKNNITIGDNVTLLN
jgi:uncharacterized membrane protein (UPF0127 family)